MSQSWEKSLLESRLCPVSGRALSKDECVGKGSVQGAKDEYPVLLEDEEEGWGWHQQGQWAGVSRCVDSRASIQMARN